MQVNQAIKNNKKPANENITKKRPKQQIRSNCRLHVFKHDARTL